MGENTWLGYLLTLLLSSGGTATLTLIVRGRKEARKIGAETASIEQKTGPEVDSLYLDNATTALAMQQRVNESQAAEIVRLEAVIARKDEHIVLLEGSLATMNDRLNAAEFSLRSARVERDHLEEQLKRLRDESPNEGAS